MWLTGTITLQTLVGVEQANVGDACFSLIKDLLMRWSVRPNCKAFKLLSRNISSVISTKSSERFKMKTPTWTIESWTWSSYLCLIVSQSWRGNCTLILLNEMRLTTKLKKLTKLATDSLALGIPRHTDHKIPVCSEIGIG